MEGIHHFYVVKTIDMLPGSMVGHDLGNKIRVSTPLLPYNSFLNYRD